MRPLELCGPGANCPRCPSLLAALLVDGAFYVKWQFFSPCNIGRLHIWRLSHLRFLVSALDWFLFHTIINPPGIRTSVLWESKQWVCRTHYKFKIIRDRFVFYSILFYSILFYSILFYSILFHSILFYSILFCAYI